MKASIVDLRYKTSDILKALDKNESVTISYHGKIKGVIQPVRKQSKLKIKEHPFFGMYSKHKETVLEELENLRATRHAL